MMRSRRGSLFKASSAFLKPGFALLSEAVVLIIAAIPPSQAMENASDRDNFCPPCESPLSKQGGQSTLYFHSFRGGVEDDFIRIISYAPIALFAESLRVQNAIVECIIMPFSVSPCLTGCIKDLHTLWDLDILSLFGDINSGSSTYAVGSIRHGNSWSLANASLLRATSLIERKSSPTFFLAEVGELTRVTTVHVSFIRPVVKAANSPDTKTWSKLAITSVLITTAQCLVQIAAIVLSVMYGMTIEILLMACPAINVAILVILRCWTKPGFANADSIKSDVQRSARGGAALDVHIIASNWNSCRIDALCGYSSHLHSLTNIPASLRNPRVLRWSCRILAVCLPLQAAALACVIGRRSINGLSAVAWFGLYLTMLLFNSMVDRLWLAEKLERNIGIVDFAGVAEFQSRRTALAFLAMLPVSHKSDRWAWLDVFMPPNSRRMQWEAELDTCPAIRGISDIVVVAPRPATTGSTTEMTQVTTGENVNSPTMSEPTPGTSPSSGITANNWSTTGGNISSLSRSNISQALEAYNTAEFQQSLRRFKEGVKFD